MTTTLNTHLSNLAHFTPGVNDGLATLDSSGKVPASQLPNYLLGAMHYIGTWDANTNTPPLVGGVGTAGQYYKVSTTGNTLLDGINVWYPGDLAIFNGSAWDRVDGSANEVLSVAGKTGAVALAVGDVAGAAPLASPTFTGAPLAPTPDAASNDTSIATTAFVQTKTNALGTMSVQNANNVTITGGTINGVSVGTNARGTRTVSTAVPSGGADGDIWLKV